MKAVITHAAGKCPEAAGSLIACPGHMVDVPEYTEGQFGAAILTAVTFGYKAAERGDNLEKCLEDARAFFK